MWDIITKYWLQFVLGAIASGLTALCSYFYHLYKKERKRKKSAQTEKIVSEVKGLIDDNNKDIMKIILEEEKASKCADAKVAAQMDGIQKDLNILTEGMLSIQGKQFKDECRSLLQEDHVITLQEYEDITSEHKIYNGLHGNHEGDSLFSLVKIKYEAELK